MWKYPSQKLVVRADNLMVTIDCPPQILVVLDNRKGLISNADYLYHIESKHVSSTFFKNSQNFQINFKNHVILYFK